MAGALRKTMLYLGLADDRGGQEYAEEYHDEYVEDYQDFEPGPVPDWVAKEREQKERSAASKSSRFATPSAPAGTPAPVESGVQPGQQNIAPVHLDPSKFPGGIVPTKLPPKRMQGRVKTRGR